MHMNLSRYVKVDNGLCEIIIQTANFPTYNLHIQMHNRSSFWNCHVASIYMWNNRVNIWTLFCACPTLNTVLCCFNIKCFLQQMFHIWLCYVTEKRHGMWSCQPTAKFGSTWHPRLYQRDAHMLFLMYLTGLCRLQTQWSAAGSAVSSSSS